VVVSAVTQDAAVEIHAASDAIVVDGGFDGFFATHHAPLVRALSLALGDDELGRDAAAEGFARALQRWGKVGGYDNPAGWVYRVGLNWARSRRRKTVREISQVAAVGQRRAEVDTATTADSDLRIVPALRRLSPEHRAVVVAKYYLDWSEQQIADGLDIRPGTVKSRLSRALERLADDLGAA
jgi:RNA polymerase sigma-70 factor (ECF subfamily)